MGLYFEFISNSIQKSLTYRVNIWMKLFGKIMYLLVQVSIWRALYASNASGGNGALKDMVTYIIVANVINTFIEFDIINFVNSKIQNGDIVLDLMKPFNYIGYVFCYGFGGNIVNIFSQTIPLLLCAVLFFGFRVQLGNYILFFLLSLLLSIVISFLYAFLIGILAFWLFVTWPLNMLMNSIYKLLSGVWIPIWLFPGVLKKIVTFLPFQYIYYVPTLIFTKPQASSYEMIAGQLIWIVVLALLCGVVWKRGRKKLVIQGG